MKHLFCFCSLLTIFNTYYVQGPALARNVACQALPSPQHLVRELPTQVAATFYIVQDPALFNTCYSDALQVSGQFRFDAA